MNKVYIKILSWLLIASLPYSAQSSDAEFYLLGKLEYEIHHLIISNIEGVLKQVNVRGGQYIEKGQKLAAVSGIEYGVINQEIINDTGHNIVAETYLKQGDRVNKFQPIMRLVERDNFHIVAPVFSHNIHQIEIGQDLEVTFSPERGPVPIQGQVKAVNYLEGQVPYANIEVAFDIQRCKEDKKCKHFLKPNTLVNITIKNNHG